MNIINRPKKIGLKPETIKRFKDKFTLDKYGLISKEVNEEYDDYDIY